MKLLKILLITIGTLSLFACNAGNDTTSTTQNINGTSPISLSGLANNCTQSSGVCNISISYVANNGNSHAGQSIYYKYGNNIAALQSNGTNCSSISTYNSTPSTCNATVNIIANSQQTITFYVGNNNINPTQITNGNGNTSINIGSN